MPQLRAVRNVSGDSAHEIGYHPVPFRPGISCRRMSHGDGLDAGAVGERVVSESGGGQAVDDDLFAPLPAVGRKQPAADPLFILRPDPGAELFRLP